MHTGILSAMPQRRRAAIYCRISQDREGAGLGVERQLQDCKQLAAKLDWDVVQVFTDNDISAYSGKRRAGYQDLLSALRTGAIDSVIVWHTDRLHRSPRELEEFVDVCERHKVITQTVKAGELDLATPSGRAVARTLGAWARFEVEHKSERTKRAQLQAAQAGRWIGGTTPYGWVLRDDGSAILDRAAARRIRQASVDLLAGVSLGSIVRRWNEGQHFSPTGLPWSYTSLKQVLLRSRNAGLIEYGGEIVAKSPWPAIVTEDTWRALAAMLADPSRRRSSSNRVRWLVSGMALCGKSGCGARMRTSTPPPRRSGYSPGVRSYRCIARGSGHVARLCAPVDAHVRAVVGDRLARADVSELLIEPGAPDMSAAHDEAVALRRRLQEAAESFADGGISQAQLATISARVTARLAAVEAEMNYGHRQSLLGDIVRAASPRDAWLAASIERQRAIIRELVEVVILPGQRSKIFDPDLIVFDWK